MSVLISKEVDSTCHRCLGTGKVVEIIRYPDVGEKETWVDCSCAAALTKRGDSDA